MDDHTGGARYVEPRDESETIEYVQLYKDAWVMTPGVLEWLNQVRRT